MHHKTLNNLNMDTVNISVLAGHVNVASAIHDRLSTDVGNVIVMPSSDNKIIVKSTVDK